MVRHAACLAAVVLLAQVVCAPESVAQELQLLIRGAPPAAELLGSGYDLEARKFAPTRCLAGGMITEPTSQLWDDFKSKDPATAERAIASSAIFEIEVATDYGSLRKAVVGDAYLEETFLQGGQEIDLRVLRQLALGKLSSFIVFTGESVLHGDTISFYSPIGSRLPPHLDDKRRRGTASDLRELTRTCGDYYVGDVITAIRYSYIISINHSSFSEADSFRAHARERYAGKQSGEALDNIHSEIAYNYAYNAATLERYPPINAASPGPLSEKIIRAMAASPAIHRARLEPMGFHLPRPVSTIRATMAHVYPKLMHVQELAEEVRKEQGRRLYIRATPDRLDRGVRPKVIYPFSPMRFDLSEFSDRELRDADGELAKFLAFLDGRLAGCLRAQSACLSDGEVATADWVDSSPSRDLLLLSSPEAPCQRVDRDGKCLACDFVVGKSLASGEQATWDILEPRADAPPGYGHRYACRNLKDGLYLVGLEPGAYLEIAQFSEAGDDETLDQRHVAEYALALEVTVPIVDNQNRGVRSKVLDNHPDWDEVGRIYTVNVRPQNGTIEVALRANTCVGFGAEPAAGFCKLRFGRITVTPIPEN